VPVSDAAYAPYPVTSGPAVFRLVRTVVPTGEGDVVVHHRDGPDPVLMLHGAAGSWTTWTPLLLAELGTRAGLDARGLVLVDLPGWGSSAAPIVPLDTGRAASVVLDVLGALGALGIWCVDVLGHSLGAFVGMHVAVVAPDRVRSVAMVSPTTFAAIDAVRRPIAGVVRLPAFALLRAAFGLFPRAAPAMLRTLTGFGLLPALASPVFTHVRRLDPSVLRAFLGDLRPVAFLGAARAGAAYDTGRWRAVRCPIAVVAGASDAFALPSDLDRLRALVPHAAITVLPDAGHFAHVEAPHAVLAALRP
jgi:pimeloyl-ACP methyl ester carboxylesterase